MLHAHRNHDLLRDLAVDRLHGVMASAIVKSPDHRGMRAYHRAHDAAFGAAIGTNGGDVDQHAVAVHRVADYVGCYKNIPNETRFERRTQRACIWDDEAKAVAMHGEASDNQILV